MAKSPHWLPPRYRSKNSMILSGRKLLPMPYWTGLSISLSGLSCMENPSEEKNLNRIVYICKIKQRKNRQKWWLFTNIKWMLFLLLNKNFPGGQFIVANGGHFHCYFHKYSHQNYCTLSILAVAQYYMYDLRFVYFLKYSHVHNFNVTMFVVNYVRQIYKIM